MPTARLRRWLWNQLVTPIHNHPEGGRDPSSYCDGCVQTARQQLSRVTWLPRPTNWTAEEGGRAAASSAGGGT